MKIKKLVIGLFVALFAVTFSSFAMAQSIVTPLEPQGWQTYNDNGGAVSFVKDMSAPSGEGAIRMITDETNGAYAQVGYSTNTPLSDVNELSYYTKHIRRGNSQLPQAPYFYLIVCLGTTSDNQCINGSETVLKYDPVSNGNSVFDRTWQPWNVSSGQFSYSSSYNDGLTCNLLNNSSYPLSTLKSICPSAKVTEYGVGVGTSNPNYEVLSDLIKFNDKTHDFELKVRRTR